MLNNLSVDPGPALLAESVEQMKLMGSPNQLEAVSANIEKRAPRFADVGRRHHSGTARARQRPSASKQSTSPLQSKTGLLRRIAPRQ